MKKIKILYTMFLMLILCMSCSGEKSIDSVLKNGGKSFAFGKQEEEYEFISSEQALQDLMDKYADACINPSSKTLTEEETKKVIDDSDDKTGADKKEENNTVASRDELKRWIQRMYDESKSTLIVQATDGYEFDIEELGKVGEEVYEEDGYDAICLESYSLGNLGDTYTIVFNYSYSENELRQMKEEERILIQESLNKLDYKGLTEYEKVCLVNEYLCDNIEYHPGPEPYPADSHTVYSTLKKNVAVCDGYSKTTQLLLNEMGVECILEVGECTNGGGHAWNLVKVEEDWYQLDVTWNDGGNRSEFLLTTDEYMKKSRTWDYGKYPSTPKEAYIP